MIRHDNYEIQKELAQKYFLKFDQEELIRKFGLQHDEENIYVEFAGAGYRIGRRTGQVTRLDVQAEAAGFNEVLSIFDLLCHSEEPPRSSGVWAPVNSLKGRPAIGVGTKFFDRYAQEFDKAPDRFAAACEKLGAKKVPMGDIGYEIPIFCGMSVIVKFYASDDEFPAQVTALWDEDALKYVYYETTYYIVNHLFEKIAENMR